MVAGVFLGLSSLAGDDLVGEIMLGLFGLSVALFGLNSVLYCLSCHPEGIHIRALRRRSIAAEAVDHVAVQPAPGYGRPRLRIDVHLRTGARIKLTTLQRYDTAESRQRSKSDAEALSRALGVPVEG